MMETERLTKRWRDMDIEHIYLQHIDFDGKEQFMFMTVNWEMRTFTQSSELMSEAEVRQGFLASGIPVNEIDVKIAAARNEC
jgi:hypothetical protein